ncbi:MAG TPA: hypothetical protein VJ820_20135 [Propionibacteriaceae bacterium]|nr:hypothetical protein [Propionibacteriaceae bacterium]
MKRLNRTEINVIIFFIVFLAAGWVVLNSFVTGAYVMTCDDFVTEGCYPPPAHYP